MSYTYTITIKSSSTLEDLVGRNSSKIFSGMLLSQIARWLPQNGKVFAKDVSDGVAITGEIGGETAFTFFVNDYTPYSSRSGDMTIELELGKTQDGQTFKLGSDEPMEAFAKSLSNVVQREFGG